MKMSELFPSRFLKADDLRGREQRVEIDYLDLEEVTDDERKPCLFFKGKTKGLVLNKSNAATLAAAYGDDSEAWASRLVIVFPTQTMFGGKMVACIRLRVPADSQPLTPGNLPEAVAAAGDDEVSF